MAQKKLIYDLSGKIKESTGNYYDDSGSGSLVLKNVTFNSMSLNIPDGIIFVTGSQITSSNATVNGESIVWDNINNRWTSRKGSLVDISTIKTSPLAGSDVSGTFDDIKVNVVSNINSGTLSVEHGGTGLSTSSFPQNESILLGNGTSPFTFLTSAISSDREILASSLHGWTNITQSKYDITAEICVYTGSDTWVKPEGTQYIRVLAQGGGGGGGSGANRNNGVTALGGAGGGAGGFVDTGIILAGDLSNISIPITVGSGGIGANYPNTNSSGLNGSDGGSSSFGNLVYAFGGKGGNGGNINSSITSSGGVGVSGSSMFNNFTYNTSKEIKSSLKGINNSITAGSSYNFPYNFKEHNDLIFNDSDTVLYLDGNSNNIINKALGNPGTSITSLIYTQKLSNKYVLAFQGTSKDTDNAVSVTGLGTYSNFTLDFWFFTEKTNFTTMLLDMRTGTPATNNGCIIIDTNNKLSWVPTTGDSILTSNIAFNPFQWYHVALVVKNGATSELYINGIKEAEGSTFNENFSQFFIGHNRLGNVQLLRGYIKNMRLSKVARWTQNFNVLDSIEYVYNYAGAGASGGSLINSNYTENYVGGNGSPNNTGGSLSNFDAQPTPETSSIKAIGLENVLFSNNTHMYDLYDSPGAGGGASAKVTETFDSGTILLMHSSISDPVKDDSLNKLTAVTSSFIKVISTGSVPPINNLMTDGIISSSIGVFGQPGYYVKNCRSITGDYSIESWFYLNNTGSTGDVDARCGLFTLGRAANASQGIGLTINRNGLLRIITDGAYVSSPASFGNVSSLTASWMHIVLQRSGSNTTVFVNGTGSTSATISPTITDGYCSYGIGGSVYENYNFNGFAKELRVLNYARTTSQIRDYYISASTGLIPPEYANPLPIENSYPGGLGGDGKWGSGGGGGGASTNNTGSTVGTKQGGNGGNGYIAVISYKN